MTSKAFRPNSGTPDRFRVIVPNSLGCPRLTLDDEPRALALRATAYEQPVEPYLLAKLRRACELWNAGEGALAHIHLAQRICRPAMKNGRCACSWRTSFLKRSRPPS